MSAQVIPFNKPKEVEQRCSFCAKPASSVKKLIGGMNDKAICDQCIAKASALIAQGEQA